MKTFLIDFRLIILILQSCYCVSVDYQRNFALPPVMLSPYFVGQSTTTSSVGTDEVRLINLDLADACKNCNESININCSNAVNNRQAFEIDHNESFVVPFARAEDIDMWTRCFNISSLNVIIEQAPEFIKGIVLINQCDFTSSLDLEFEYSIPIYNAANSASFQKGQITTLPRHRDSAEVQILPPACDDIPPQPHAIDALSGPWINPPSYVLDGNTQTYWKSTSMNGYIVFDFGCFVNVTKMYINVVRNGYNNPKQVRLDGSDDLQNWRYTQIFDIPSVSGSMGINILETRCRYLRFYVLSTYNEGSLAYVDKSFQ